MAGRHYDMFRVTPRKEQPLPLTSELHPEEQERLKALEALTSAEIAAISRRTATCLDGSVHPVPGKK